MKKTKKIMTLLSIAGMVLLMSPFNAFADSAVPTRLGGTTAEQTAALIAEQTGWTGTAILASSTPYGMVDALTAGPLAKFLKAPILLQGVGNVLNPDTQTELASLKVKTVYVTSGTAVIKQAVLEQLTGLGIKVVSLGGADRFETSVNIARQMVALGANVSKVALAFGWLNQDALSIASIASAQTEPILLTEKDTIPAGVKAFLTANPGVHTTDVIGGTAVISEAVRAQMPKAARFSGNTAYDTNVAVLKAFDSVLKYDHVFIANGETAIDALAGAPLAAMYNAGIVLANGTSFNEGINYARSKIAAAGIVTALGGPAVVPEVVRTGVVFTGPASTGGGGGSSGSSGGGGAPTIPVTTPTVTTSSVAVKIAPSKVTYTSGDTLDLTGLVVTLTKSDSSTQDIALPDFAANGITTVKTNCDPLLLTDTSVVITVNGKTVSQPITVHAAADTWNLTKGVLTSDLTINLSGTSEATQYEVWANGQAISGKIAISGANNYFRTLSVTFDDITQLSVKLFNADGDLVGQATLSGTTTNGAGSGTINF